MPIAAPRPVRLALLLCLVGASFTGCTLEEVQPAPDGASAEALPADSRSEADALELGARGDAVIADEGTPPAEAAIYRLRRIVLGDATCTLDLQPASGDAEMRLAYAGVCSQAEAENLIGRPVRVEFGSGQVSAASCQDNPECDELQTVELVTRIHAVG